MIELQALNRWFYMVGVSRVQVSAKFPEDAHFFAQYREYGIDSGTWIQTVFAVRKGKRTISVKRLKMARNPYAYSSGNENLTAWYWVTCPIAKLTLF